MWNRPFSTVIYIIWINCWSLVFGMNVCMCHSALLESSGHGVSSVWPLLTVSDPECLQCRIILDVLGCVDMGNKQLLAYCSIKYWHIDLLCSFLPREFGCHSHVALDRAAALLCFHPCSSSVAEFCRKHHSCFWCLEKSCQCFETFLQNLRVTSKIISAVFVQWNKLLVQFSNSSSYSGWNSYSLCCFKELKTTGEGALQ